MYAVVVTQTGYRPEILAQSTDRATAVGLYACCVDSPDASFALAVRDADGLWRDYWSGTVFVLARAV